MSPVLPAYGQAAVADLMGSVAARLAVPGCRDVVGVGGASRWVVLLVDGLGWDVLHGALGSAGFLAELVGDASRLTAGVPSTTVTSLTSLGSGLVPGQHGVAGFSFRRPETGTLLNALLWSGDPDPYAYQPTATVLERAAAAGVAVSRVLPARFEGSGLTEAGLRGGRFVPEPESDEDRVAAVAEAAVAGERTLVYHYVRELDHTGHTLGVASSQWRHQLGRVGRFVHALRAALPTDVTLLVTGDHGMLDVPAHHRLVAEDDPQLVAGVDLLAGEARFRQLYTREPEAVARRWADRLGERAWVRTRDEAVAEGWFGVTAERVAARFGDVVVAMRTDWGVLTTTFPKEHQLVGMHGSLTAAEMVVPLLRVPG